MDVTIRGVLFEDVDFTELETASAYEDGHNAFIEMANGLTSKKSVRDQIMEVHDCVSDWLDGVFGDGAADEVFKGAISMKDSAEAAADMMKAFAEGLNDMRESMEVAKGETDKILNKSSGNVQNRAQRRAAERATRTATRKKRNRSDGENPSEHQE